MRPCVLAGILLASSAVAAPAPAYRGPAPRFAGWHVCKWRVADYPDHECGWWGEFLADGTVRTPADADCGMGQARWNFDESSRVLTLDWPKVSWRACVHVGTGDGHEIDSRKGSLERAVTGFSITPHRP